MAGIVSSYYGSGVKFTIPNWRRPDGLKSTGQLQVDLVDFNGQYICHAHVEEEYQMIPYSFYASIIHIVTKLDAVKNFYLSDITLENFRYIFLEVGNLENCFSLRRANMFEEEESFHFKRLR